MKAPERTFAQRQASRIIAEHAEMKKLLREIRDGIFDQKDNIPSPGKYIRPIDALLARIDGRTV